MFLSRIAWIIERGSYSLQPQPDLISTVRWEKPHVFRIASLLQFFNSFVFLLTGKAIQLFKEQLKKTSLISLLLGSNVKESRVQFVRSKITIPTGWAL